MHEHEEFPTDDPRTKGVGDQYPEEGPEGQIPAEGDEQGPASGAGDPGAPSTSSPEDGDPGQATGNPHAAGGAV